jgi:hypothetical protein
MIRSRVPKADCSTAVACFRGPQAGVECGLRPVRVSAFLLCSGGEDCRIYGSDFCGLGLGRSRECIVRRCDLTIYMESGQHPGPVAAAVPGGSALHGPAPRV